MNYNLTKQDVYVAYRKAQAFAKGRGYRLPKDWDAFYQKMALDKRNALTQVTHWFNTKWKDIDPERYFLCGFELFKNFTYHQFSLRPVIALYIRKDKTIKRQDRINKEQLIYNVKWVKDYMGMLNIPTFFIYCNTRRNNRLLPIQHYLDNELDAFFITWLIKDKIIGNLTDDERSVIPFVMDNYRENVIKLEGIQPFLEKLRSML